MQAEIITIGDEILIGQTINTNAAYIGEELTKIQIAVSRTVVVGDEESAILGEFKSAFENNDIVIVTGGLGPTHDDITKECIVRFFNTELEMNPDVLEDVKSIFERRGRQMAKINETQALVPKIARVIRNTRGTAPGMWIEKDNKVLISLPGVPHEMKEMIDSEVIPGISKMNRRSSSCIKIKNLLSTGIAESTLFERLGDLNELLQGAKLAFLPSQFGVRMRITAEDKTEDLALNKLSEIEQKIRSLVGRYIYGIENDTLEEVISRLLLERGLTIAIAESCTGGLVSHRVTNVSGSSSYFERAVISYSNAAKVELLNVNEDIIAQYGAVSLEVARQMAEGIKSVSGTDIGLSITGILGPGGATREKPVGLVYIGLCNETLCTAKKFQFSEDRLLNKDRASQAALEMLRRHLLGIPYDE
ncbi:MAG: competence/damage-inducible protein A [Bacteroidota bacterium]|jgi:nicotinamide-nucleotide amidase|nr:competence/damage-inducible protein A [Ignavibacteria bacterium]MCU7500787.1 competence/damage-inducible protein A [Ignavibacteria bacterium]MCU7520486.1 competence/damage-inducible protein A [Ignavibacteria bacterium]MCU7524738.1 competence/damage-inducible protein A [Ignavibacteria bacterium]